MDIEDVKRIITGDAPYASRYCPEAAPLQQNARRLCWEYNQTSPDDADRREQILRQLLGTYPAGGLNIQPDFRCDYGFNIHFGGFALVNYNVTVLDTSPVRIGADAFIGPGTCIACAGHSLDPEQRARGIATSAPITIGERVWLGANVTVCAGVTIGDGSVIGAGAVVTKDVPAGVVAAGVPCHVVRQLGPEDQIDPTSLAF